MVANPRAQSIFSSNISELIIAIDIVEIQSNENESIEQNTITAF